MSSAFPSAPWSLISSSPGNYSSFGCMQSKLHCPTSQAFQALLKVEDKLSFKKKKKKGGGLFYSILFPFLNYMFVANSGPIFCAESQPGKDVFLRRKKKKDLCVAEKKDTQNISLCIFADGVMSLLLQRHAVLKCHIQRLRSWYAERRIQQRRSGPDTCQGAGGIKHKEWSGVCLITKGLCAVFVPAAAVCSSTSLSTLSPKSLPIVRLCVVLLVLMMHGKSMELFRIYLSLSPGRDPYKQPLLPLHLYCNDLSFLATAAICKSHARLINAVYKFSR